MYGWEGLFLGHSFVDFGGLGRGVVFLHTGGEVLVLFNRDFDFVLGHFGLVIAGDSRLKVRSTFAEVLLAAGPTTSFGGGAVGKVVELIRFVVGRVAEDGRIGVRIGGGGGRG